MEEDLEVSSKRRFDIYFGLAGFVLGSSISLEEKTRSAIYFDEDIDLLDHYES